MQWVSHRQAMKNYHEALQVINKNNAMNREEVFGKSGEN